MANGTQIHQWGFHRGNTQKWEFKHYDDGYYYIRSCNTSAVPMYYLTVQNDSTVEGAKIVLQSSISTGSQWKITSTSNGAYKITAKTGEANNRVLAVEWVTGDTTANGLDMEQKNYQDNDSYLDEWIICNSALLLAIDDSDGASRHTYFLKTKENLETEKNGFSSSTSTARYSSCSIPDMINYLKSSNIFVIHTHGIQTGFKIKKTGLRPSFF